MWSRSRSRYLLAVRVLVTVTVRVCVFVSPCPVQSLSRVARASEEHRSGAISGAQYGRNNGRSGGDQERLALDFPSLFGRRACLSVRGSIRREHGGEAIPASDVWAAGWNRPAA